jgi:two-component system chemotaxis sensor kinase CheA
MAYNPLQTILHEAEELLADIEQAALGVGGADGTETVNRLFRAFHTIKGSGAMCGLTKVADFTHHVETLLAAVREGSVGVSPSLTSVLLASADHIRRLLEAEQSGQPADTAPGERLVQQIRKLEVSAPSDEQMWAIRFRPDASYLACGGNPILLFRDLRALGRCEIEAHTEDVPALDSLHAERCYLYWTVRLTTGAGENAIRDVFIFAEGGSELEVERLDHAPRVEAGPPRPAEGGTAGRPAGNESTVRVPAARLDRLVNLLGELVMNQSRLSQAAALAGGTELANPVQEIERLVAALRDDVLGIRMLPIGTIFSRFRRVAHDLSAELGKEAELITEGEETELDKSILDRLGEPLAHLLRNALDHGIESPAERVRNGKPARGTIRLRAEHTGSAVVIRAEDDGRGIDCAAVRARAIEKQLIAPDAVLTPKDIANLILTPGFSTARSVTSVSGRGVGMDAVKKQVEALRGTVSISSEEGKGCRVSLTLPLTLAIIEGLVVSLADDRFIIPMSVITENVELHRRERERNNGRNVVAVRGELVPYIDLREAFAAPGTSPAVEKVVIVRHEDQRVGLVVDRVIGTHQTVIQSLGRLLREVEVVSGATIMGDGSVALILDVAAVVRRAGERRESGLAA